MPSLQDLEERRAYECRLTPNRALETIDEADEFVRERGLVTRTADCSLPSLHEACHEEEYKPGAGGFGSWPKTKWWWGFELAQRPGVVAAKIHRGKTLFLGPGAAALADPICREELRRARDADDGWARLLHHLGEMGPSLAEDVRLELGLRPRELREQRGPLERCGAIVASFVRLEGTDDYATVLARWDQVHPDRSPGGGLEHLVVAGVRAAVVCPESEPKRWFSWTWRWDDALVDRLVGGGRLTRPVPGLLALPDG